MSTCSASAHARKRLALLERLANEGNECFLLKLKDRIDR
jgi:hypothetical protein